MNGQIHESLAGKIIKNVFHDDKRLIIETECGHRVRIVWGKEGPEREGVDCTVILPGVFNVGKGASFPQR